MVSGFFDFAENRALDHIPTTMNDYRMMLDRILSAGGSPLMTPKTPDYAHNHKQVGGTLKLVVN